MLDLPPTQEIAVGKQRFVGILPRPGVGGIVPSYEVEVRLAPFPVSSTPIELFHAG